MTFRCVFLVTCLSLWVYGSYGAKRDRPNIVVIFCDDLGYGDLGIYGHPTIATPNIDRLAFEGQKWTNFYCAAPVCTPSRAGLMTGRLPVRSGMASRIKRVLFPDAKGGLPQTEITIARHLRDAGYNTAIIGKWHLGHLKEYAPKAHGFDYAYGIPYSNDMDRVGVGAYFDDLKKAHPPAYFHVPLIKNGEIIERPVDQYTLTMRYTEEAVEFIRAHREAPFFLYLAHSMPHVPLFASEEFRGKSLRGLYGDTVEEIDWSVGRIVDALKETGLDSNTLVIFTSDNGPWLTFEEQGGSAGLLSGGKGGTYEGGMRVPGIFWWPGRIKSGVIRELGSTLDIFPTVSALAGLTLPLGRVYDGYDLQPVLIHHAESPREIIYFYRDDQVYAIRKGAYKVHFITQDDWAAHHERTEHTIPLLFDVNHDPGERVNIAAENPEIIETFRALLKQHQDTVVPVENQLER